MGEVARADYFETAAEAAQAVTDRRRGLRPRCASSWRKGAGVGSSLSSGSPTLSPYRKTAVAHGNDEHPRCMPQRGGSTVCHDSIGTRFRSPCAGIRSVRVPSGITAGVGHVIPLQVER